MSNRLLHELFAIHARQVRGFFRRRIGERGDATDLTQEVFLRLLRLQDLGSIDDPQRYIFTVASNLLKERSHGRKRSDLAPRVPIEDVLNAPELSVELPTEQDIDTEKLVAHLREVLRTLPVRDREVLALVYVEKLSYREIARRWGISKTAVEKAVTRATVRCRLQMEGRVPYASEYG
jgi:RNA polymerase sigma factor (sigma-70 family)